MDVRTKQERDFAYIKPSLFIPLNELESKIDELPKDKLIVVYCHSGTRSAYATAFLKQKGYTAENLDGGINSYSEIDKKIKKY